MPDEVGYVAVRVQVGWGDCDPAGIVFYPRFYAWMDMGSHALARRLGIPREATLPPGPDMLGFPVVGAQAQFVRPALIDDVLEVRTWVARVGRSSFSLRHEIIRLDSGEILVRGRDDRVFVGRSPQGGLQSRELTSEMRKVMARFADPSADGEHGLPGS